MELNIKAKTKDDYVIIYVTGQLDSLNCVELHDAISDQIDRDLINILLNFRQLSFIDSTCLGALLKSLDNVKTRGGNMVVVGNRFVDRVLAVTGLAHIFNLYPSEEEALEYLKSFIKEQKSA